MGRSHGIQCLMFPFQVKVINEELYRKTLEEIVRSLDKMENANIPSVSLSKREVGRTCWHQVLLIIELKSHLIRLRIPGGTYLTLVFLDKVRLMMLAKKRGVIGLDYVYLSIF